MFLHTFYSHVKSNCNEDCEELLVSVNWPLSSLFSDTLSAFKAHDIELSLIIPLVLIWWYSQMRRRLQISFFLWYTCSFQVSYGGFVLTFKENSNFLFLRPILSFVYTFNWWIYMLIDLFSQIFMASSSKKMQCDSEEEDQKEEGTTWKKLYQLIYSKI